MQLLSSNMTEKATLPSNEVSHQIALSSSRALYIYVDDAIIALHKVFKIVQTR